MMIGVGPDLRQMRDHEHLAPPGRPLCHRRERLTHPATDLTPDALVHLVEDERRNGVVLRQNDFQRQHQARQFASRGDFGERARVQTQIELDFEKDILCALGAGSGERYQTGREPTTLHPERWQ